MIDVNAVVTHIIGDLKLLDDGETEPTTYFNDALYELPDNPAFGDKGLVIVEAVEDYNFQYIGGCRVIHNTRVNITIINQGTSDISRPANYDQTKIVKEYLIGDESFGNTCTGSLLQQVMYGYKPVDEELLSASRIILELKG
jgi:hypothetical protein